MLAGLPVVHTAPSHHGFASVLRSLFSSITLSKPHTLLFLALPVVPWHTPLHQHVGLGIKNRPAHIFLGLSFPARLWLTVFLTGFFSFLIFPFCRLCDGQQLRRGGQGACLGASVATLQDQEPVGGGSEAVLAVLLQAGPFCCVWGCSG